MTAVDELVRYDGNRVVVTGCASGIGAQVARQVTELGGRVIGLDLRPPGGRAWHRRFHRGRPVRPGVHRRGGRTRSSGPVDALFNVAGVSSGIGNPLLVVTINFLGTRQLHRGAGCPGCRRVRRSRACPRWRRRPTGRTPAARAGLLDTASMAEGLALVRRASRGARRRRLPAVQGGDHPLRRCAASTTLGARGIRINCTGPGVTETPILDQLRSAYGQDFLDSFPPRWAGCPNPTSRPRCWCS